MIVSTSSFFCAFVILYLDDFRDCVLLSFSTSLRRSWNSNNSSNISFPIFLPPPVAWFLKNIVIVYRSTTLFSCIEFILARHSFISGILSKFFTLIFNLSDNKNDFRKYSVTSSFLKKISIPIVRPKTIQSEFWKNQTLKIKIYKNWKLILNQT